MHAQRAEQDRLAFFPEPKVPHFNCIRRGDLPGGWVEDLSFPSYHAPDRAIALEFLRRYPENATAFARHYRHAGAGHPAVVCLHGWGGGSFPVEARIFGARWLYEQGLDVYLYVHPYHGARRPADVRIGATLYPSSDIGRTNEGMLQAAWELRTLVARHRQLTGAGAGVMGMSLGGYTTAMLATVAPELAFAVPMMPIADLPALMWKLGEGSKDRKEAEASGVSFADLCRAMSVHSPLAHPLALPRERVLIIAGKGDTIVPPDHAAALWEHFDRPQIHWFAGGHLMHFGREGYLLHLQRLLVELGLLRRPRAPRLAALA